MKFTVDGEDYELDENALTFKDVRDMEVVTGVRFTEEGAQSFVSDAGMAGVQAVVWIAMRKKNPDLKFSDTDNIPISTLTTIAEQGTDPSQGGEQKPGPRKSRGSSPSTSRSSQARSTA